MQTTLKTRVPPYVGVDLTDRYSIGCRAIDICGLTPTQNNELAATFWSWEWDRAPEPLNVTSIAEELAGTRAAMLDGPQGLAASGNAARACERQSAAVGKTPDVRPGLTEPFAGFICSSLDLFAALSKAGALVGSRSFVDGVSEVYPGHMWMILTKHLHRKSTKDGRLARRRILEILGVTGLPELPTHDENDACVAALVAAAADGGVPNLTVAGIGSHLFTDQSGTLREGQMVIPVITATASREISEALRQTVGPAERASTEERTGSIGCAKSVALAEGLLERFVGAALSGKPEVCTYSWAYRHLLGKHDHWSQHYASAVVEVARLTSLRQLLGLGPVHLDAFVVGRKTGLPSAGHWTSVRYDREDWERVLGGAQVLHRWDEER